MCVCVVVCLQGCFQREHSVLYLSLCLCFQPTAGLLVTHVGLFVVVVVFVACVGRCVLGMSVCMLSRRLPTSVCRVCLGVCGMRCGGTQLVYCAKALEDRRDLGPMSSAVACVCLDVYLVCVCVVLWCVYRDVSSVSTLSYTFGCASAFNQPLSSW